MPSSLVILHVLTFSLPQSAPFIKDAIETLDEEDEDDSDDY
jgi:hypothetical protein